MPFSANTTIYNQNILSRVGDLKHLLWIKVQSNRLFGDLNPRYVLGTIPEELTYRVTGDYSEQFENSGEGVISATSRFLTGQVVGAGAISTSKWTGSSPIDWDISFDLVAEEDSRKEVVEPLLVLLSLAVPSLGDASLSDGSDEAADVLRRSRHNILERIKSEDTIKNIIDDLFLFPPGPNFSGLSNRGDDITVHIGEFIYLPAVIITNVDAEVSGIMNTDGLPVKATVNVNFQSALPNSSELVQVMHNYSTNLSALSNVDDNDRRSLSDIIDSLRNTG